jgi:acyl-CoA thioesterase
MVTEEGSINSTNLERHKEQIERFNACEFARMLGMIIIEAAPGMARVVMHPGGKANPNGVLHGGAVFAVADQAFGIAANLDNIPQVAVSAGIWYLSSASGKLEAIAKRVSETDSHSLYRVKVFEGDRLVATFEGVGIKQAGGNHERLSLSPDSPIQNSICLDEFLVKKATRFRFT